MEDHEMALDAPPLWTTREEKVLTQCWITDCESVPAHALPHLHVTNNWNNIQNLFNGMIGFGNFRTSEDLETKWEEMYRRMIWCQRYFLMHRRNSPGACDEHLVEDIIEFYILNHNGRDFEHEEAWMLLLNKSYFK